MKKSHALTSRALTSHALTSHALTGLFIALSLATLARASTNSDPMAELTIAGITHAGTFGDHATRPDGSTVSDLGFDAATITENYVRIRSELADGEDVATANRVASTDIGRTAASQPANAEPTASDSNRRIMSLGSDSTVDMRERNQ